MVGSAAHDVAQRLLKHLDNGSSTDRASDPMTLDVSTYTDPNAWERDRDAVLRRYPTVVALSTELGDPGSFKTTDLGGLPVVVVRGRDGLAHAFVNRCSHRGTELVRGRGTARRFTCPFHGWSFEHSGRLVNITASDNFCDPARADYDLTTLPVREERGMIWVAGTRGVDIEQIDLLTGLDEDIRQLDLDRWHYQYSEPLPTAMNWRMLLEAGFETYHLPYLHAKTASRVFYSNVITFDRFGKHFRMAFPRRTIDELRETPEADWDDPVRHLNLIYYLFPNTILLHNAGMWQAFPGTSPGEGIMHFNFFTIGDDPTMTEDQAKRFQFAIDVTREEDNPAAEAAYRNFLADPRHSIVLGRNEVCLQHLNQQLDSAAHAESVS